MGAFDALNEANGVEDKIKVPPTAEDCPNHNCRFWSVANCALAECRYTVPEVIYAQVTRKCQICGGPFTTDAIGIECICHKCVADIKEAIAQKHWPRP